MRGEKKGGEGMKEGGGKRRRNREGGKERELKKGWERGNREK